MVLCNTALCQIDQNSPVTSLTAKETIFLAQVAGYWSRTIGALAPCIMKFRVTFILEYCDESIKCPGVRTVTSRLWRSCCVLLNGCFCSPYVASVMPATTPPLQGARRLTQAQEMLWKVPLCSVLSH